MMFMMFVLGGVVIVAGFLFDQADFAASVLAREGVAIPDVQAPEFAWNTFLAASAVLFSSFIGFDSIAQAGGEAKNPSRNLPIAIGIAILSVGSFYLLFTAAMYHAVPWAFIAERAQDQDLTAPGLLGYLLSPSWTVLIVAGAAIALINDLPAMLLAVSRLMFAWAEDGIFPKGVAQVHPTRHTPHVAIILSGSMATVGILGSHWAGDFFLGVDILVTSMLVNFLVMCLSVLILPAAESGDREGRAGPAQPTTTGPRGGARRPSPRASSSWCTSRRTSGPTSGAWYFHSTWIWLGVMALATTIYVYEVGKLKKSGVDSGRPLPHPPAGVSRCPSNAPRWGATSRSPAFSRVSGRSPTWSAAAASSTPPSLHGRCSRT